MTYPRAHLVDEQNGGTYLCTSRCVRRAWLCGEDPLSGQSFEHRRGWIEHRLLELSAIFAIDLHAYAVMSNHHHSVLHVDPQRVQGWDDTEVARRWCQLQVVKDDADRQAKEHALIDDKARLTETRRRLGSLSWYMRYLNEFIARRANREDEVTGRFWQGRFDSEALLDDTAVIAGMTYVDLNPVRANMATELANAVHTSIARRLAHSDNVDSLGLTALGTLGFTLAQYTELLQWTVAVHRGGAPPPAGHAAHALNRLGYRAQTWLARVHIHRLHYRAYGTRSVLKRYAQSLGQLWVKGMRTIP